MIINTLADIDALNLDNEYEVRNLKDAFTLKTEIEKYHPCVMERPEYCQITLWLDKENGIEITRTYKGEFHVFGRRADISFGQQENIKKILIAEPKNFKVLSAKNLNNWIAYTLEFQRLCKLQKEENAKKITEFLAKVDAMQKAGCKTILHKDGLSGWIEKGALTYSFSCDMQSGYVTQSIRFNESQNIETMAKLSNIKL